MSSPYPPPYPGPQPSGPQPYPPALGTARPRHLRGYRPLWLALITLVIAVVFFVIGGVVIGTKAYGKVSDFQRVSFASGSGTVTLTATGKWVLYYEAHNVSNSLDELPAFRVAVADPSGTPVEMGTYGNRSDGKVKKLTYSYNGHKGAAAYEFTATSTGTYQVRLLASASVPAGAGIAIGRDIGGSTLAGGLLILVGLLFLVAAVVLLIVGLVKRVRHRKELDAGMFYGGAYPAQPWPGSASGAPPGQGWPEQQPGPGQGWPGAQPGWPQGQGWPGAQPGWPQGQPPQPSAPHDPSPWQQPSSQDPSPWQQPPVWPEQQPPGGPEPWQGPGEQR